MFRNKKINILKMFRFKKVQKEADLETRKPE
jgi:hypothetical protein